MVGVDKAPRFSGEDAVRLARDLYGVDVAAEPLPSERDQNFQLRDARGGRFVLKIANREERRDVLEMQNSLFEFLERHPLGLEFPRVVSDLRGTAITSVSGSDGAEYLVRLLTWVDGTCMALAAPHSAELLGSLGAALGRMDNGLEGFSHPGVQRVFHWDLRQAALAREHLNLLPARQRQIVEPLFEAWAAIDWQSLRSGVIYNDANDYNVLVDASGSRVVSLLDFGDVVHSATVCDLAIGVAYAMLDKPDPIGAAAQVVAAYHGVRPLTAAEVEALYSLVTTRLAASVCYAAWQRREAPGNDYLNISNQPAWGLLDRLAALPPGWPDEVFRRVCGFARGAQQGVALAAAREKTLGPSLSLSYERPLHIIRGWKQHLYDSQGRAFLDCVNNVAHVGHSHPRVVEAAARQMALLNTNTRYLYEGLTDYVERLTSTLPEPLRVAFLVTSGSEANELALRMAKAHTGGDQVVVVDAAYHGNTNALVEISPYKFNGRGGRGQPAHVHIAAMPDVYRGAHRGADAGERYAQSVADEVVHAAGRAPGLAAFFCEAALGCGGQIILPEGYLTNAFAAVRDAGGVCIADEVQTGFGRAGSHFWMFETQGVVPDIVTMGKPIGNGHPLGAVVTTPEIARSFANGMEYFNTFGGNPVSCAVGMAVLDVIRDEGLQENARVTGESLLAGLRELVGRHELIADVRGQGLFVGFEMVRDRETKEPAAAEASALVEGMKEMGVLLSTDGPFHNVIKIKPPMVFGEKDAGVLVERLDKVMGRVARAVAG